MIDFNLEELTLQYNTNKKVMNREYLYRMIDLLLESNKSLIETMEDISDKQDREIDRSSYRDDRD